MLLKLKMIQVAQSIIFCTYYEPKLIFYMSHKKNGPSDNDVQYFGVNNIAPATNIVYLKQITNFS
jgi:hypothetical protein